MKRILLLLLLVSGFLFSEEVVFSNIDECKTDVYFGNGILTKEKDAIRNTGILEDAIIEKLSLDYFQKHIGKVSYAYNDTFGFAQDIFESALQITNLSDYVDWWASKLPGYKKSVHEANIKDQVDKYEASIRLGHRVLVVAHSQGNLFAQEAYEKLGERSAAHEKWLQKYWEAVSIASPDPFTDIKPDMLPRIGWDNDLVAIGGGSVSKECKIRKVKWVDAHPAVEASKPKYNYVPKEYLNKLYAHKWKAVEGWWQKLDSNVHAFTFYMGQPIKDGKSGEVFLNPFTGKEMIDDTLKPVIMGQIETLLKKLEKLPSQWEPKNFGCVCDEKYAKLTHKYEKETFRFPQKKVKDFAEDQEGKIYMVGGQYIRAACGGERIEKVDEGEVCLALLDGQDRRLGIIVSVSVGVSG